MSTWRTAVTAASVGAGLVGAATFGGLAAQRAVRRYRELGDPGESFDALAADRTYSVATGDGVALHVEEAGPLDAPLTVVFAHGFTLRSGAWHFQRLGLAGPGYGESGADDPAVRMVFFDQRSHGRSTRTGRATSMVELAEDLRAVIQTAAPDGPVVLVGHSMGGMAIITLAGQDPPLFAQRVAGVGLISTSASEIDGIRAWRTAGNSMAPVVAAAASRYPRIFERGRATGHDAIWLLTRAFGFGDRDVPGAVVDYLDRMISGTPVDVIAEFLPTLLGHHQLEQLPALAGIPALILVGDQDRMTPVLRSQAMADVLGDAEFLIVPDAGHMVIMERPDEVNQALRRLLRHTAQRAAAGAPVDRPRRARSADRRTASSR